MCVSFAILFANIFRKAVERSPRVMETMDSPTPPILHGPTSKEKKFGPIFIGPGKKLTCSYRYDRQLRLWAASGQAALEDARIILINSGPGVVGVEALKNLILPGEPEVHCRSKKSVF